MEFQKLLDEVLKVVCVKLEGGNCHKIFSYSVTCDPKTESTGEGIMEARLRKAIRDDHGQPHS